MRKKSQSTWNYLLETLLKSKMTLKQSEMKVKNKLSINLNPENLFTLIQRQRGLVKDFI